jgi:hypothetical protein
MRRHLVRTAVRVSVLLAGDAAALLLLRVVLRGVRDVGWLGPATSDLINGIIPQGALPLVQLLPAVLLGLIALDTYGASDRRRDAGRLVAGATLGLALPFWAHLWNHFSPLLLPGFILLAGLIGLTLITERHLIDQAVRVLWPIGPGAARGSSVVPSIPVERWSIQPCPTLDPLHSAGYWIRMSLADRLGTPDSLVCARRSSATRLILWC